MSLSKQSLDSEQHLQLNRGRYLDDTYGNIRMNMINEKGIPPRAAYELIHDELQLDSNPNLNLASFVTTKMDPECDQLIVENLNVNAADRNIYGHAQEIQNRCVSMLSHLWHARDVGNEAIGTSTIGSSEAIFLGLLALLYRWRHREIDRNGKDPFEEVENGKPRKPNLVVSADSHVTLLKFERYFRVEVRVVPLKPDRLHMTPQDVAQYLDANTIGVVAVLGNQLNGIMDDVPAISAAIDLKIKQAGWNFDIPIHVDAASGGFVAPFIFEDYSWDFRIDRVVSINASGHKYGGVYPGLGWVIWRNAAALPKDLVYSINYLGADEATFNLNFSKPSTGFIAQYYNFLRLGMDGYRKIIRGCHDNARLLSLLLKNTGYFVEISQLDKPSLPIVVVSIKDEFKIKVPAHDLVNSLKAKNWAVPAYPMAPDAQQIEVMRFVVRETLTENMVRSLAKAVKDSFIEVMEHSELHERLALSCKVDNAPKQVETAEGNKHKVELDSDSVDQHRIPHHQVHAATVHTKAISNYDKKRTHMRLSNQPC